MGFLGCASDPPSAPAPEEPRHGELELVIDETLQGKPERAWMHYVEMRSKAISMRPASVHNQSLDDFTIEFAARRALATRWAELRGAEAAQDKYLDALLAVHQAGHLEEYVLAVFGRPGWTIPPASLDAIDFPRFQAYAVDHLRDHAVETRAMVRGGGLAEFPDQPGAALPELELRATDGSMCGQRAEAQQALERWYAEAASLDGVPVAAGDARELSVSIALVRSSPEVRARGVTWVSPMAAVTSFHVGFCEVDRREYAASIGPLETAVALFPQVPMWRLELAKSFTVVKRFDEAEQMIQSVISSTADTCVLGSAWRAKGYLLIDRGRLREAYDAYLESLQHDPASAIARSELALIRKELASTGEGGDVPPEYVPPGMGDQSVTQCPGS